MRTIRPLIVFAALLLFLFSTELSGQISGTVTSGNWYRIAQNSGTWKRANARFVLTDQISGGGHSTLEFIAGISYNDEVHMGFTLLNHSIYNTPTFTKIRILEKSTYDPQYIEVYVARSGSVNFSILDNLQSSGWDAVSWQTGSIPSGYTAHEYDVNNSFVVGDSDTRFTVKRGGKIGIGTSTPHETLEINGNIRGNQYGALRISTGSGYIDIGPKNTTWAHIYTDREKFIFNKDIYSYNGGFSSYNTANINFKTNGVTRMTVLNSNGRVGIGKTNPIAQLDVNGSFAISGSSHLIFAHTNGNGVINFGNAGDGNLYFRSLNIAGNINTYNQLMILTYDGKLGIGTWEPGEYMLAVNGKIRAKEVNVDTDWSDFVFDPGYHLYSLREIEDFINDYGHLPGIPSAKDVKKNGISIGEMQSKLLQKIEELTLYLIDIKKENVLLKEKINSLEIKLDKIR